MFNIWLLFTDEVLPGEKLIKSPAHDTSDDEEGQQNGKFYKKSKNYCLFAFFETTHDN